MTLGLSARVATQFPSCLTRNNTEQYILVSYEKEKGKEIQTFFAAPIHSISSKKVCVPFLATFSPTGSSPAELINNIHRGTQSERTKKQWEDLFDAGGFTINSIVPLRDNFGASIVEGMKR